jgi:hypothetical protein
VSKYSFYLLQSQNIQYTLLVPTADKAVTTEGYSDMQGLGSESMYGAYLIEKQIIWWRTKRNSRSNFCGGDVVPGSEEGLPWWWRSDIEFSLFQARFNQILVHWVL